MKNLKDQLSNLFQISSEDYLTCSQLIKDRDIQGKLDQKRLIEIIKILCDYIEEQDK
jgi:hypothetical protein